MNLEFTDEYVDEDDPGFDTYVVNEENFVASCQELARLNDFPVRAIMPDNRKDMAMRERIRKEQQAEKDAIKKRSKTLGKQSKLKTNDSALLLSKLAKEKKKGQDVNEKDLEKLRELSRSETDTVLDSQDGNAASVLP